MIRPHQLNKDNFFARPSAQEILKHKNSTESDNKNLVSKLLALSPSEALVITQQIIPEQFFSENKDRNAAQRKFLKHGPEVRLRRTYSVEQLIEDKRTPVALRYEQFEALHRLKLSAEQSFSCYSYMPNGKDSRKRKVGLVECMEGTRLFYYMHHAKIDANLANYGTPEKAKRVDKEGSTYVLSVPSRTPKHLKHTLKLSSVPTQDTPEKYRIWSNIGSDHSCNNLRFRIGYKYYDDKEDSSTFYFDAHEIAAYLTVVDHAYHKDKNIIPLQMCLAH